MREFEITIGVPPVTKKNHQQIVRNTATGRTIVIQSKAYKAYEAAARAELSNPEVYSPDVPDAKVDYPVNVKAVFYMQTHRRVDLVNLEEALLDVLVRAGVIADDNSAIVVSMDGSRVDYDKEFPRTEVVISEVKQ